MSLLHDMLNAVRSVVSKFGLFADGDKKSFDDVSKKIFSKPVLWTNTDDANFPYQATVDNDEWKLRINDFPEEEMFTLLINNKPVLSFTQKPQAWTFPSLSDTQSLSN